MTTASSQGFVSQINSHYSHETPFPSGSQMIVTNGHPAETKIARLEAGFLGSRGLSRSVSSLFLLARRFGKIEEKKSEDDRDSGKRTVGGLPETKWP